MIDQRQHIIGKLIGFDTEEITVAGTEIGLTVSKLTATPKPKEAFIQCETAQCRYYYDGSVPTSTSGFILNPMDTVRIKGHSNLNNFLAIRTGGTSAKLTVCYER
jgi:hypothetical protein